MKNEPEFSPIDALLASYLAGESDAAGVAEAEAWIAASEENRAYFESMRKTWNATAAKHAAHRFDTDAAWSKLKSRMEETTTQPAKRKNYGWVAAVLFLLGFGVVTWQLMSTADPVKQMQLASTDALLTDTLSDGSVISLNRDSKLDYPSSFDKNGRREVTLTGEAFFDVAHDAEHPFIIHTPLMDVKVLGTSFNVRAYPNSDSVRVSVKTGRVQCTAAGDTVVITPGEFAVYHKDTGRLRKGIDEDPNTLSYRSRIFSFRRTPLSEAITKLNDVYGSSIVLKNDQLRNCPLDADFKNQTIDNIISVIEVALNLSAKREGKNIVLDGPGCQ